MTERIRVSVHLSSWCFPNINRAFAFAGIVTCAVGPIRVTWLNPEKDVSVTSTVPAE